MQINLFLYSPAFLMMFSYKSFESFNVYNFRLFKMFSLFKDHQFGITTTYFITLEAFRCTQDSQYFKNAHCESFDTPPQPFPHSVLCWIISLCNHIGSDINLGDNEIKMKIRNTGERLTGMWVLTSTLQWALLWSFPNTKQQKKKWYLIIVHYKYRSESYLTLWCFKKKQSNNH